MEGIQANHPIIPGSKKVIGHGLISIKSNFPFIVSGIFKIISLSLNLFSPIEISNLSVDA